MLCGDQQRIEEVLRFKSNMDSGMFLPLQLAAAKALTLDETWHIELNHYYSKRREKVFQLLDELECVYRKDQVGLFVWAKIPDRYSNSYELSDGCCMHQKYLLHLEEYSAVQEKHSSA